MTTHTRSLQDSIRNLGEAFSHAALMIEALLTNGRGLRDRIVRRKPADSVFGDCVWTADWRVERDHARFALLRARNYLTGRWPE